MRKQLNQEAYRLLTFLLVSLLFGWIVDQLIVTIAFGSALFIAYHGHQLVKLVKWIERPSREIPNLTGVWEEMAYRVFRIRRRSESRKEKISRLLKRYQLSTQSLPDATILLNGEDEIEWFNASANRLLNLEKKDIGQPVSRLIRDPGFVEYMNSSALDEPPLEILSPIDDSKYLDVRVVPSAFDQRLVLIRDITYIHRLSEMRRDFVANVSHELRTPLTIVIGYLETIEGLDDLSVEELQQLVGKMNGPAHRMKSLVEDLLQLSQLDTGVIPTPAQCPVIDVPILLKSIARDAGQISAGHHKIEIDIDPNLRLLGIEKEIYSVFSNLVNNAVRYTPEQGLIKVIWKAVPKGALFEVIDSGVGIGPEYIDRLTERFFRVDVSRSRDSGGTGLGLSIVKQVLRRHDSELSITSTLGQGSTFSCLFITERVQLKTSAVAQSA